ncbi:hypothetical protein C2845_PM05G16400 [Panicum miliaceum]|uniref:Uncharacterized protein n=1 Tax=Panicum miliaceum TaxID=4540 RepID=A0A3L6SV48_PANMI|nr:hypothetical protein C2845_PM05G16400 [Panicum miliaceum]
MLPGGWYLFRHGHAADITSEHVAAWLRFGQSRVTGRFTLAVPVVPPRYATDAMIRTAAIDPADRKLYAEMPASVRAETMSLNLGNANLTVPVAGAGAFRPLSDLLLSHARIEPGGADERNLGHLMSASCCPRLRRLWLEHITGLAALRLHAAAALEELRLNHVQGLTTLELDAPGLRALHVAGCYRMVDVGSTARISAPMLEVMACADTCPPDGLQFDGAASVRLLEKMFLWSHAPDEHWNAGAVWLLQHCTAADSLSVDIACFENDTCSEAGCLCNLDDDPTITLEHLREVKITGFPSSMYHRSLVQLMITGAPALEKMTVELIKDPLSKGQNDSKDPGFNMTCKGQWAPPISGRSPGHRNVTIYEWEADAKREEGREGLDGLALSRWVGDGKQVL